MIRKKFLILSMVAIVLNVPVKSYAHVLNNFQLATANSDSSSSSLEGGTVPSSSEQNPIQEPPENQGNSNVIMDGAIGEWDPDNDELPDFGTSEGGEKLEVENKPTEGKYYTISATVPLSMEFLIQNKNENGLSYYGKFITPYYKVTNNGSHKLNVHFESFEHDDYISKSNKTQDLEQLYVVETPQNGNGRVEMKLDLTYDRPFNSYFKKIHLVPSNTSSIISRFLNLRNATEAQLLGELEPNEEARLYYGSDEWESPKSEGINTGVEADFNLKLAFSIDRKITDITPPVETPDDSEEKPEGSPDQPPEASTEGEGVDGED